MTEPLRIERRNVYIGKRRTTLALENYFWKTLEGISFVENKTIDEILTTINDARGGDARLTPTIRYVVNQTMHFQHDGEISTDEMNEAPPQFPSAFHQAMNTLKRSDDYRNGR